MKKFKKQTVRNFIIRITICFMFSVIFIGFGATFAQNLHIIKDNQAQVIVEELNVYDKPPILVKTGFLKWDWKFGKVIYTLKQGDKVEILEIKKLARYKWAKIKYKDQDTRKEIIGWCFLGSKHSSFISFVYAQDFSSPEKREMQGINLSFSAFLCLCLILITPFFVFKFLPTNNEKYKFSLSIFFALVVLLIFGYIKSEDICTIIKLWGK